jgi:hypothetical protein
MALLATLTGCSTATGVGGSNEELELARNRQRWASAGLRDYEFDFQRLCFCTPEVTEPVHIIVRNDVVTSVVRRRDGQPASMQYTTWPRVDELFEDVQRRLSPRAERLDVQYDPTYGYPRSIVVDVQLMMADDEYALTAGNLRRLP